MLLPASQRSRAKLVPAGGCIYFTLYIGGAGFPPLVLGTDYVVVAEQQAYPKQKWHVFLPPASC